MCNAIILAAGLGQRLSARQVPKPLIRIAGKPLIQRQIEYLEYAGISDLHIILRPEHTDVLRFIEGLKTRVRITILLKGTDGGMFSLFSIGETLKNDEGFFLLAIDNILDPNEIKNFVVTRKNKKHPHIVTWVQRRSDCFPTESVGILFDKNQRVIDFGKHIDYSEYIAEGPFHCQYSILSSELQDLAIRRGISRLSEYFKLLLENKHQIGVYISGKVIDVDTPKDIKEAETYIRDLKRSSPRG